MKMMRYAGGAVVAAALFAGTFALVAAQTPTPTTSPSSVPPGVRRMTVSIGAAGHVLLRGTVDAVSTNSLTVKSWGGVWTVNISPSTSILPGGDISQFQIGDFVGVQGTMDQSASWTIQTKLVRDWNALQEIRGTHQQIQQLMRSETPKNRQGTASDINVSGNSLTLTVKGTAYTVNLTAGAKVVNRNFLPINLSEVNSGDTVRVWGTASGTTITAAVLRDVSLPAK